jgi:hypothetical protein
MVNLEHYALTGLLLAHPRKFEEITEPEWDEMSREVFTNIEAADNFVFIISPESVASANCRKRSTCRGRQQADGSNLLSPVADEAIPEALGRFQRIDFGDNDNLDLKFAALTAALDTDLAWVQIHNVVRASCASVCASCLCLPADEQSCSDESPVEC